MKTINSLHGVEIREGRRQGNTERIINNIIELLFQDNEVLIIDHSIRNEGRINLMHRLSERLGYYYNMSENKNYIIKYDSGDYYIKLKKEDNRVMLNTKKFG